VGGECLVVRSVIGNSRMASLISSSFPVDRPVLDCKSGGVSLIRLNMVVLTLYAMNWCVCQLCESEKRREYARNRF
jgi:hypothetical protein